MNEEQNRNYLDNNYPLLFEKSYRGECISVRVDGTKQHIIHKRYNERQAHSVDTHYVIYDSEKYAFISINNLNYRNPINTKCSSVNFTEIDWNSENRLDVTFKFTNYVIANEKIKEYLSPENNYYIEALDYTFFRFGKYSYFIKLQGRDLKSAWISGEFEKSFMNDVPLHQDMLRELDKISPRASKNAIAYEQAIQRQEDEQWEAQQMRNQEMKRRAKHTWDPRESAELTNGAKVCTNYPTNFFGFVEEANNLNVKVRLVGKSETSFFDGSNRRFRYKKLNEIRWFKRQEVAYCEFEY